MYFPNYVQRARQQLSKESAETQHQKCINEPKLKPKWDVHIARRDSLRPSGWGPKAIRTAVDLCRSTPGPPKCTSRFGIGLGMKYPPPYPSGNGQGTTQTCCAAVPLGGKIHEWSLFMGGPITNAIQDECDSAGKNFDEYCRTFGKPSPGGVASKAVII